MAVCTAKAMLQGKRNGVWGMLVKTSSDRNDDRAEDLRARLGFHKDNDNV
jgi:hypothetical protein